MFEYGIKKTMDLNNDLGITMSDAADVTGWTLDEIGYLVSTCQVDWDKCKGRIVISMSSLKRIIDLFENAKARGVQFVPLENATKTWGASACSCMVSLHYVCILKNGKIYVTYSPLKKEEEEICETGKINKIQR